MQKIHVEHTLGSLIANTVILSMKPTQSSSKLLVIDGAKLA
jgi:hypothetical protein